MITNNDTNYDYQIMIPIMIAKYEQPLKQSNSLLQREKKMCCVYASPASNKQKSFKPPKSWETALSVKLALNSRNFPPVSLIWKKW